MSRDWLWAILIGGLAAASPLTGSARLVPSIAGGVLVGAATFWVRRRGLLVRLVAPMDTPPRAPANADASSRSAAATAAAVLTGIAALAVCAPALVWLWQQYTISIWRNGHGLFLPLVVFVMARRSLRDADVPLRSDPAWAAGFLALAVGLSWLGANARIGQLATLGLAFMVPGLCLLWLGLPATRRIAFPLALLVFLLPLPDNLEDPLGLATATAAVAEQILALVGVVAARVETIFVWPGLQVAVTTNCSGVSTLYAGVLLALLLGQGAAWPVRLLLLAAVWPLTVFFNSFRIVTLVLGVLEWGPEFSHTPLHGLAGIAVFWAVMAGLAGVAYLARWRGATS